MAAIDGTILVDKDLSLGSLDLCKSVANSKPAAPTVRGAAKPPVTYVAAAPPIIKPTVSNVFAQKLAEPRFLNDHGALCSVSSDT